MCDSAEHDGPVKQMDNGYHITEGLDEPLRRMLDTAMDELSTRRGMRARIRRAPADMA